MKALVTALALTVLALTAHANERLTPSQSRAILGHVTHSTMIRAVIAERTKQGARCSSQLIKFSQTSAGSYDVEATIQCNLPDGDDVGGGGTILNVKASLSDDVILSMTVSLAEVG